MIDIHSHILPYLDDGAENTGEFLRLAEIARDNAVKAIIATPHFYSYHRVKELTKKRDGVLDKMRDILARQVIDLKLYGGFEVYCREEILQIKDFSALTLAGSRYMLCEFDFNEPDTLVFIRCIEHFHARGIVPVIAHPERYAAFFSDYEALNDIARRGVLFQLNVGSLFGGYGQRERRLALTMLQCGFCDFLATDAHSVNNRSSNLLEMIIASGAEFAVGELRTVTQDNPEKIIRNDDINIPRRGTINYDALL